MSKLLFGAIAGFIVALLQSIFMFIAVGSGNFQLSGVVTLLQYVVVWGAFCLSLYYYKKNYCKETFTFGRGMKLAAISSVTFGLVYAVVVYISYSCNSSIVNGLLDEQRHVLADTGMPSEQIDQAMDLVLTVMQPSVVAVIQFFSTAVSGLIVGAIAMAFLNEKEDDFKSAMKGVE